MFWLKQNSIFVDCASRVIYNGKFTLDNPRFSALAELAPKASQATAEPLPPTASGSSASAPSFGDSTHCNCLQCRRRRSKTVFDRHTVCFRCCGYDCSFDRCDECLDWSQEEMEAYVQHRRSLLSKDKKGKDSLLKPPSSLGPIQPPSPPVTLSLSDIDECISGHITVLSYSFERRLETLTNVLLDKFTSFASSDQVTMSARMPNHYFAAPP